MNRTCTQCQNEFIESTIQYYRRLTKDSPIICQSCYRLQEAESRALKRSLVKNRHIQSEYGDRKPNIISTMMKYKVTHAKAKEMMESI